MTEWRISGILISARGLPISFRIIKSLYMMEPFVLIKSVTRGEYGSI